MSSWIGHCIELDAEPCSQGSARWKIAISFISPLQKCLLIETPPVDKTIEPIINSDMMRKCNFTSSNIRITTMIEQKCYFLSI